MGTYLKTLFLLFIAFNHLSGQESFVTVQDLAGTKWLFEAENAQKYSLSFADNGKAKIEQSNFFIPVSYAIEDSLLLLKRDLGGEYVTNSFKILSMSEQTIELLDIDQNEISFGVKFEHHLSDIDIFNNLVKINRGAIENIDPCEEGKYGEDYIELLIGASRSAYYSKQLNSTYLIVYEDRVVGGDKDADNLIDEVVKYHREKGKILNPDLIKNVNFSLTVSEEMLLPEIARIILRYDDLLAYDHYLSLATSQKYKDCKLKIDVKEFLAKGGVSLKEYLMNL